jgi:adenosine deaminase
LHVHLDGSFQHDIMLEHLVRVGYDVLPNETILPWDGSKYPVRSLVEATNSDYSKFHFLLTCRGKRSLQEMIKCFEILLPIVQGEMALLERLAHDFVKRQADQHVIYTEVRYSPHLLAKGGAFNSEDEQEQKQEGIVDARSVVDAITRGLIRGEKEYGVKVNQILCCITWRPDWAEDVVDIAAERQHTSADSANDEQFSSRVVGIDIAAGEEHFDAQKFPNLHEPHVKAFRRAKELGLNITMHAGEVESGNNVLDAINKYHATRIGHGYRAVTHPEILEEVKRKGIHFETCPTSSLETGGWEFDESQGKNWEEHPLVSMIDHGLSVGLNSDDPAVFDTSLTFQYRVASSKMKLEYKDLALSVWHSIDAAFLKEDEKEKLREKLRSFYESHGSPFELPPIHHLQSSASSS